jgi:hypothetical protein
MNIGIIDSAPKIITNGLVLHLDAAQKRSYPGTGTVWTDLSGNGNNGTLTNGPTFDSGNGGSIVFDGTNDSVNIVQSNALNVNTFTWSAWVNAAYSLNRCFFFIGNAVGQSITPYKIFIGTLGSAPAALRINYNGTAINLGGLTNNLTYNLTITYNGSVTSMYVNGSSIGTSTSKTGNLNSATYAYVGSTAQSLEFFSGKIFTTLFYNRALSDAEVLQNYNATKSRFGL